MKKIKPISGFPEWLPQQKLVEDAYISRIRTIYESYGYVPIETSAVELVEVLAEQGVTDKEIYGLRRLQDEDDSESKLGLHFDLTIPFSRYVAQNMEHLHFPFRRYQIQKVWRGERPQKGRFREFYQFDADLVARDELPICCDAEILTMMNRAFKALAIGPYRIAVNNRKCFLGRLRSLGIDDTLSKNVLVTIDKLHKIGKNETLKELLLCGLSQEKAEALVMWCLKEYTAKEFLDSNCELESCEELEENGRQELRDILGLVSDETLNHLIFCPSLVRGLDYYTGLIFEVTLPEFPNYGSVGAGGRYDNLLSRFSHQKLPGVGGSIGLTRLMDLIFNKAVSSSVSIRTLPQLMISVLNEEQRPICNRVAETARKLGVPTEVFFKSPRLGKQIEYAVDRGIPFVAFIAADGVEIEIKDLKLKSQGVVENFESWCKHLAESMIRLV